MHLPAPPFYFLRRPLNAAAAGPGASSARSAPVLILTLTLLLVFHFSACCSCFTPVNAQPYAAAFLTEQSHNALLTSFSNLTTLCPIHRSDANPFADRVVLSPNSLYGATASVSAQGQKQRIRLVAYARDQYVQTVVISQESAFDSKGNPASVQFSSSVYPLVLMSASADIFNSSENSIDVQTYSQNLWQRMESLEYIQIERDQINTDFASRITNVRFPAESYSPIQYFILPPTRFFPATTTQVVLLDPTDPTNYIEGVVCANSSWTKDNCGIAPWPTPGELPPVDSLNLFFSSEVSQSLISNFVVNPCDESFDVVSIAQHSTIQFNPPDPHVYDPFIGQTQTYSIVAYARDEHASTVLLRLDTPADPTKAVYSHNSYSHTTLTAMSLNGDYGAVYSNVIWTRLVNASIITVNRDSNGHVFNATLNSSPSGTGIQFSRLDNWVDEQYEFATYTATNVFVKIFDGSFTIDGIVCMSNLWNDQLYTCAGGPSTSSSSSTGAEPIIGSSSTGSSGESDDHPNGLSTGAYAGIGIGCGVVLMAFVFLGAKCWKKRNANRGLDDSLLDSDYHQMSSNSLNTSLNG